MSTRVIDALVRNPHLPFGALRVLTDNKVLWTRNLHTPTGVLDELSRDTNWYIRICVAGNPNTPQDVLSRMSQDPDWLVRVRTKGPRIRYIRAHSGWVLSC